MDFTKDQTLIDLSLVYWLPNFGWATNCNESRKLQKIFHFTTYLKQARQRLRWTFYSKPFGHVVYDVMNTMDLSILFRFSDKIIFTCPVTRICKPNDL